MISMRMAMNTRFNPNGPKCSGCQYFNKNATWPDKKEGQHCYMFDEWDYKQDGNHCISSFKPLYRPDTAEENLMDNQL